MNLRQAIIKAHGPIFYLMENYEIFDKRFSQFAKLVRRAKMMNHAK